MSGFGIIKNGIFMSPYPTKITARYFPCPKPIPISVGACSADSDTILELLIRYVKENGKSAIRGVDLL